MKSANCPKSCIVAAASVFSLAIVSHAQNAAPPPKAVGLEQRQQAESGTASLKQRWMDFIKHPPKAETAAPGPRTRGGAKPAAMSPTDKDPTNPEFARKSNAAYVEPDVLRSKNGVLELTLNAEYADFMIGDDPVYLRTFNPGDKPSGKLVGPTLILHPGDTLRIKLQNKLPAQRWRPNMMNTLNTFNTLNIHYHGLHVSPNGISDNVLILVGPQECQDYEVVIPKDHTTGTYWYHPHRHGSTAGDVASGMSGALIIEADPGQQALDNVPEVKAAEQRVMVLNQIPYIYKNVFPSPLPPVKIDLPKGVVEEMYAGYMFGPGDWAKLKRFSTINGVQLPVIKMRPGQVERWRLVDSGQRESMKLRIVRADDPASATAVKFHEVAVDGLTTGRIDERDLIELWPGYRSDVLVKAPAAGEYFLVDGAAPVKYVARISISGAPMDMKLPDAVSVSGLGQKNIADSEITGQQSTTYGILLVGGAPVFTIDGKSFSMESARQLHLNDVDEWTISSSNQVGPVTHPFHIHVNPFQVTSIMAPEFDADGNEVMVNGSVKLLEQLDLDSKGKPIPVWRDTVKIPGDGYVKMRTRYTDFIGTFVQHCHILDHEDQGMMELIDIVQPRPTVAKAAAGLKPVTDSIAADFKLPDANGKLHSLTDVKGKPTVIFFFKGHGCLHCVQQVTAFTDHYKEFQKKGIQVIGVTTDTEKALKTALEDFPCPFTLLADPKGVAFGKYGCVSGNELQHGTFTLDSTHNITWSTIGASPFIAVTELLKDTPPRALTKSAISSPEKKQASIIPVK